MTREQIDHARRYLEQSNAYTAEVRLIFEERAALLDALKRIVSPELPTVATREQAQRVYEQQQVAAFANARSVLDKADT